MSRQDNSDFEDLHNLNSTKEGAPRSTAAASPHPPTWNERRSPDSSRWLIPFQRVEWACEWSAHWLKRWAFLDVLDRLGRLAILVAVITWFLGIPARERAQENQRKAKIYQAWQVINAAQGKPSGGGRVEALYDLVEEGQSLSGIDLSHANLSGLQLAGQDLREANLENANLWFSDLRESRLEDANLKAAQLTNARLQGVELGAADLEGAQMVGVRLNGAKLGPLFQFGLRNRDITSMPLFDMTNLMRADLSEATLDDADLNSVQFQEASLARASLRRADLGGSNFEMADLRGADLEDVHNWKDVSSLNLANINGIVNAPKGFRVWAVEQMDAVDIDDTMHWIILKNRAKDK